MSPPPTPDQVRAHAPALAGQLAMIPADLAPPPISAPRKTAKPSFPTCGGSNSYI